VTFIEHPQADKRACLKLLFNAVWLRQCCVFRELQKITLPEEMKGWPIPFGFGAGISQLSRDGNKNC